MINSRDINKLLPQLSKQRRVTQLANEVVTPQQFGTLFGTSAGVSSV